MRIARDITALMGNTPLVRLSRLAADCPGTVVGKCEFFNPTSSVKDRIAVSMIDAAEASGALDESTVIVEPTSGNTGIGLASVCAARGYRLILTMPDSMSVERRTVLAALGAELVLTPASGGMKGAVAKAEELVESNTNHVMLQQFKNRANPAVHRATTGEEIWRDTEGLVDVFVAGVGTGGTLTGVGQALRAHKPDVELIAVEPADSPVLSGGAPGGHGIQGIGAGFVPDILDTSLITRVVTVETADAYETARLLAKREGILTGISAGANVWAALQLARDEQYRDKTIVTMLCDTGERYLSTDLFTTS